MNEPMKKWVSALRSGNYHQTRGRLKRGDEFCCLGVACDVLKEAVGGVWEPGGTFRFDTIREGGTLPIQLANLLELPNGAVCELIRMNDTYAKNFNQIADYLETL
jgi:hypothetical protein